MAVTNEQRELIRQLVHDDLGNLIEKVIVKRLCQYADEAKFYLSNTPTAAPAVVVDEVLKRWIADGDTIPPKIINACRDAICREFGNNGTDGYYKRILVKVFRALAAALGQEVANGRR